MDNLTAPPRQVIMKSTFYNACWIILEKCCFAVAGIFSSMYVARYLGPENFGTLSYTYSIIAIILPFIQLGSDSILFNRVAKNPHSGLRLMEASRYIKIIFFALFSAGLLFWAYRQLPTRQLTVLAILLVGTFFTLCDIYKTFYDATLASKINLVVNNTALIIYVGVNLVFVHLGLDLIWFAATLAMRSFIAYSVRSVIFHLKRREKKRTIHGVIKFKNIKT